MLGFNVGIYRQTNEGNSPATMTSPAGTRLAIWQTFGTLQWIDKLVEEGAVIDLGGDGYPLRYTAATENIIPKIINGPPEANPIWFSDPGDTFIEGYVGKTLIDHAAIAACRPDEWLIIEAWDES